MRILSSKLTTTAFLIIIVSVTETPYFIKYPLLLVATISLIIALHQIHKEAKAKISNQYAKLKR